jgi:putative phosphoesterase
VSLVAVIADTHLPRGDRALPVACVRWLDEADLILHAGDVVTKAVYTAIAGHGRLEAVYGNMDEPALRQSLPRQREAEIGGVRIGLVHIPGPAAGREARLVARFPGCAAIVYGHTHKPQVDKVDDVWILNPGSPTDRRTAPAHTMLLLRIEAGAIEPELLVL